MKNSADYQSILQNIVVSEYTSVNPQIVLVNDRFDKVFDLMFESDIRHLPVVENNKVVGLISQRDLLSGLNLAEREMLTAKNLMNDEPYTVYENTPLDKVCFEMSENKIGSVIVLDREDKLYGVFTTTDALNALVEILRGDVESQDSMSL